jgi:hypothetical protein
MCLLQLACLVVNQRVRLMHDIGSKGYLAYVTGPHVVQCLLVCPQAFYRPGLVCGGIPPTLNTSKVYSDSWLQKVLK